ncbi:MAG TPA: RluA family pseudouridine synthase [Caproiciproducens sp.]|nr:RluA family pseudouridine synthase [Caproiciproducens sp.]
MRKLEFKVPKEYDGIRLKNFLRGFCALSSRLMIRLKREPMGITRNGQHAIVTEVLRGGDLISLLIPDDAKQLEPVPLPLSVLFEDDDILVVDKPADMPMYPAPGHDRDSLANAVAAYFQNHGEKIAFRPVYRLDKDTTGLVVLAKNSYAAARLAGAVHKEYYAICEGELSGGGTVEMPIGIKEGHGIQREVTPNGEKAKTNWQAVGWGNRHSLLKLNLETGRTHQIRVHMAHIGHPLAGDDMYGGQLDLISRQALHCGEICFSHPVTGEKMKLQSKMPQDMQEALHKCNINNTQKVMPEFPLL